MIYHMFLLEVKKFFEMNEYLSYILSSVKKVFKPPHNINGVYTIFSLR